MRHIDRAVTILPAPVWDAAGCERVEGQSWFTSRRGHGVSQIPFLLRP